MSSEIKLNPTDKIHKELYVEGERKVDKWSII